MRQWCNVAWFMLSDGLNVEQLADLEDQVYRPLEDDRPATDADRAALLARMNMPVTVIGQ